MSRFHDLLKKVAVGESELVGESRAKADVQNVRDFVDVRAVSAEQTESAVETEQDSQNVASPIDLREVLAQLCPQGSWIPDIASPLFSRNGNSYTTGMEEFRTLRSRLNLVREKLDLRKLLITSPLPKEGKTYIAVNLAHILLRQQGCRVLLVDGDLRLPSLHDRLGAPQSPGLVDYLGGEADDFAILKRGHLENLFFVPAGKAATNASDLLAGEKLRAFLDRIAPAFDWIIIDSPPIVPVSDAKQLGQLCDGVLMVFRADCTPFDLARKAYQEFLDKPFLGVVLNQTKQSTPYGYDYYQGNGEKKS